MLKRLFFKIVQRNQHNFDYDTDISITLSLRLNNHVYFVLEVASAYQASLLVVEGSQLAGLVHSNIASLAAACLDSSCPLLAYTSTPGELNLKVYLTDGNHHPVTRDLVHVGAQVARAGAFLHGRGLLHR